MDERIPRYGFAQSERTIKARVFHPLAISLFLFTCALCALLAAAPRPFAAFTARAPLRRVDADMRYYELEPPSCAGAVRDASVFDKIYRESRWAGDGLRLDSVTPAHYYPYGKDDSQTRRSMSGTGSSLGSATEQSLKFLVNAIRELKITTMLDIPCGDVNWQMGAWETDSLSLYVGADVVPAVIALNRKRFAHHSNKQFVTWDFVSCPLPHLELRIAHARRPVQRTFDVVHVRDVLQHLSLSDGTRAAKHLLSSGIPYVIATTFPNGTNQDIKQGDYFQNNLELPPYSFPKPMRCVRTHPHLEPDLTCLYKIA